MTPLRLLFPLLLTLLLGACAQVQPAPATPNATGTPAGTATPTPLPTWTPAPTVAPGVLRVAPEETLGEISPLVYGTNYGPWSFVPLELQEQLALLAPSYLRFPGGAWGDENKLRPLQVDQFIDQARQLGAEPSISVNLRTGTVEEAAELVRYVNVEKGYGVRYWSIGNEPTLFATAHNMEYDTVRYNEEWRRFAEAMRAVDPEILLVGPDTHQYLGDPAANPQDAAGRDWMRTFLEANGDMVDVVAFHRYPFPARPTEPSPEPAVLRANSAEWERIIPALRNLIRETTGRDLPIAVTEVNSNWSQAAGSETSPDSLLGAVWWADVLGRLIAHDVQMVGHFALQAPAGAGWGIFGRSDVRPVYHVFRLYQQFGRERVAATSGLSGVSIFAARRADGALTLMVVNLSGEAGQVPLQFADPDFNGTADLYRLDESSEGTLIETLSLENGTTLSLPADSVSLFIISLE